MMTFILFSVRRIVLTILTAYSAFILCHSVCQLFLQVAPYWQ